MPSFAFNALQHAQRHMNIGPEVEWSITFENGELHQGKITEIKDGCYLIEKSDDFYYFDAHKVLYMKPLSTSAVDVRSA